MNFDKKDVKTWNNRDNVEVGDKGYFANDIHFLDDIVSMNLIGAIEEIDENDVLCFKKNGTNNFGFFLPLEKVQQIKRTGKQKYSKNKNTFDLWIANKVKVRVVTNVDNFDKTLFSILGVIKKCEKQGILLKDQNNKEHFICYPNILEVQYLGTDDWKEYLGLSIDEIDNV